MATAQEREEAAVRAAHRRSEHLLREQIKRLEDEVAGLRTSLRHDRGLFEEVAGALRDLMAEVTISDANSYAMEKAQEALNRAACSLSALPLEEK